MRRLGWTLILGSLGIPILLMLGLGIAFLLTYQEAILDFRKAIGGIESNTILYDRNGQQFHSFHRGENRLVVSLQQISRPLQLSVLAAEDTRFFQHRGVDTRRILSALWTDLLEGGWRQGASTITQQLVKLTLLTPEKTLTRKIREAGIAISLELKFSKSQILEHYLNTIYFGHGNYGIEQAARTYFGQKASALGLAEASLLASLIKKPEAYLRIPDSLSAKATHFPPEALQELLNRRRLVLAHLQELGWVAAEEVQKALASPVRMRLPKRSGELGAYFAQHVVRLLRKRHKIDEIFGEGFRVYTTLDPKVQRVAEAVIYQEFFEKQQRPEQVAFVSLEPHTGKVRALVGGKNYWTSQFDRAVMANRQPGSAFKPLLYATALERNFVPQTSYLDQPVYFEGETSEGELTVYAPRNADDQYGGERTLTNQFGELYHEDYMTLAKAFERSVNTVAVQVLHDLGIHQVTRQAQKHGITIRSEMGLCIALGCSGVSLLQLTAAYAPFVNAGRYAKPVFITRIEETSGRVLYEYQPTESKTVLSEWTAFRMRWMLENVVKRGTGRRAGWENPDRPIGGKTGTNTASRDAWFVGFTPELVAGVWVGTDDNQPMPGESGGRTPALLWHRFMRGALDTLPQRKLPPPPNHIMRSTCSVSGQLATRNCPDTLPYPYLPGNSSLEFCNLHPGFPLNSN